VKRPPIPTSPLMTSTGEPNNDRKTDHVDGSDFSLPVPPALVEAVAARALELLERRAATDAEPWIGVNDAAEHLACPRSRIYALVSAADTAYARRLAAAFRRSELDEWVARGGVRRP
jgi:predicted DNA-binding transcriptional regulator AlpA